MPASLPAFSPSRKTGWPSAQKCRKNMGPRTLISEPSFCLLRNPVTSKNPALWGFHAVALSPRQLYPSPRDSDANEDKKARKGELALPHHGCTKFARLFGPKSKLYASARSKQMPQRYRYDTKNASKDNRSILMTTLPSAFIHATARSTRFQ